MLVAERFFTTVYLLQKLCQAKFKLPSKGNVQLQTRYFKTNE